MSKFDGLLDDFLYGVKNVADAAGKKTGEVVGYSKLKYQIKQTQWDMEKAYAKLGAFVYESKKSEEDYTDLIALAVNEIELLNDKLENLEQQVLACKRVIKCSGCGKENDLQNSYCARCGSSLAEEKQAAEAQEQQQEQEDAEQVAEAMDEVISQASTQPEAQPEEQSPGDTF